jgi:hypothetical protein
MGIARDGGIEADAPAAFDCGDDAAGRLGVETTTGLGEVEGLWGVALGSGVAVSAMSGMGAVDAASSGAAGGSGGCSAIGSAAVSAVTAGPGFSGTVDCGVPVRRAVVFSSVE